VIAIRLDDLGKLAVYDERGEFVCIAINRERAGASLKELSSIARQAQRRLVRDGVKDLRAIARRIKPEIVADAAFRNAVAAAPIRDFAANASIHTTPALEAASKAADELANLETTPAPHDEATLREGERVVAELEERRRIRDSMLSDDELEELWLAITGGRGLSDRQRAFLDHFDVSAEDWRASYEQSAEFESARKCGRLAG